MQRLESIFSSLGAVFREWNQALTLEQRLRSVTDKTYSELFTWFDYQVGDINPAMFSEQKKKQLLELKKRLFNIYLLSDIDGCLVHGVMENRFPAYSREELDDLKKLRDGHRIIIPFSNRSFTNVRMIADELEAPIFMAEAGNYIGMREDNEYRRISNYEQFDENTKRAFRLLFQFMDDKYNQDKEHPKIFRYDVDTYGCFYPLSDAGLDTEQMNAESTLLLSQIHVEGKPLVSADGANPASGFFSTTFDSALNFNLTDEKYRLSKVRGARYIYDHNIEEFQRNNAVLICVDDREIAWQIGISQRRPHHTFHIIVNNALDVVRNSAIANDNYSSYSSKKTYILGVAEGVENIEIGITDALVRMI